MKQCNSYGYYFQNGYFKWLNFLWMIAITPLNAIPQGKWTDWQFWNEYDSYGSIITNGETVQMIPGANIEHVNQNVYENEFKNAMGEGDKVYCMGYGLYQSNISNDDLKRCIDIATGICIDDMNQNDFRLISKCDSNFQTNDVVQLGGYHLNNFMNENQRNYHFYYFKIKNGYNTGQFSVFDVGINVFQLQISMVDLNSNYVYQIIPMNSNTFNGINNYLLLNNMQDLNNYLSQTMYPTHDTMQWFQWNDGFIEYLNGFIQMNATDSILINIMKTFILKQQALDKTIYINFILFDNYKQLSMMQNKLKKQQQSKQFKLKMKTEHFYGKLLHEIGQITSRFNTYQQHGVQIFIHLDGEMLMTMGVYNERNNQLQKQFSSVIQHDLVINIMKAFEQNAIDTLVYTNVILFNNYNQWLMMQNKLNQKQSKQFQLQITVKTEHFYEKLFDEIQQIISQFPKDQTYAFKQQALDKMIHINFILFDNYKQWSMMKNKLKQQQSKRFKLKMKTEHFYGKLLDEIGQITSRFNTDKQDDVQIFIHLDDEWNNQLQKQFSSVIQHDLVINIMKAFEQNAIDKLVYTNVILFNNYNQWLMMQNKLNQKQSKQFQLQITVKREHFYEKLFDEIQQIISQFPKDQTYDVGIFMYFNGKILKIMVAYNELNTLQENNKYDTIYLQHLLSRNKFTFDFQHYLDNFIQMYVTNGIIHSDFILFDNYDAWSIMKNKFQQQQQQQQSKQFELKMRTEHFYTNLFEEIIQITDEFYNNKQYDIQIFMLQYDDIEQEKSKIQNEIEEQQEYEDNESDNDNNYNNYYEQLSHIIHQIGTFPFSLIIFPKLLQDNVGKKPMDENYYFSLCMIIISCGTIVCLCLRGQSNDISCRTVTVNTYNVMKTGSGNILELNQSMNDSLFNAKNGWLCMEQLYDDNVFQINLLQKYVTNKECNQINEFIFTELNLCEIKNIIGETTWKQIRIFDKMNVVDIATTLSISRVDFISKINDFINDKPEINSIILKKKESILWIIRVFEGVDVGILLRYDKEYNINNIKVDGIYLDKQRIYSELNIEKGKYNLLDNFISDIDELNIINATYDTECDMILSDTEWESESSEIIYVETDWEEWEDDEIDSELDEKMDYERDTFILNH